MHHHRHIKLTIKEFLNVAFRFVPLPNVRLDEVMGRSLGVWGWRSQSRLLKIQKRSCFKPQGTIETKAFGNTVRSEWDTLKCNFVTN